MAIGRPIEQTPNIADKVVTATATAGQTEFTVTGGYRINHLAVFRNGVRLVNGNDFTALDGVTVTLMEDASNLDVLEFQVFDSFSVSDALLTNAASQTVNGDVTVNGAFTVGSGGIGTFTAAEVVVGIVSSTTGITTIKSVQAASSTTTGALQVKGGVGIGKSLYVGGNVSVGGTLTYEDVTNVDSVGLVTAGKGVRITTGGLVVTAGVSTFAGITTVTNTAAFHSKQLNVSAGSTFGGAITASDTLTVAGNVDIADKIIHTGDTNTAIRFPSADTITAETGGSERLRVDSSGRVLIGTTTEGNADADDLTINATRAGITIRSADDNYGNIYFSDATSGSGEYAGYVQYSHGSNYLLFGTNAVDRLRIDSSGRLLLGTTTEGEATADNLTIADSGHCGITLRSGTSSVGTIFFSDSTSGTGEYEGYVQYDHSGNYLKWATSNSERLRINQYGHMGLGVTPSDWPTNADSKALQIGTGFAAFGRGSGDEDRGGIAVNYYTDGSGYKYIGNGNANRIYMADGNITFEYASTNSSGAGQAMTLTEYMKIDTSGRILIGTSTEGYADGDNLTINDTRAGMTIRSASDNYGTLFFSDATSGSGEYAGYMQYYHGDDSLRLGVGAGDRLRITSTGAIGTNSIVRAAAGGLDIQAQGATDLGTLTLGASGGANGQNRNANTENQFRIMSPTYADPSKMWTVMYGASGSSAHEINLGGGTGWAYASNLIRFFTTANQTTGTGTERLRIASDGEVFIGDGLGTTDRSTVLSVSGSNQDPGGVWTTAAIYSSDSYAQNKGGSLGFGGQDGSVTKQQFAAISGVKENGTSGDYAGSLRFWTRPSGSTTLERMKILSTGTVQIMSELLSIGASTNTGGASSGIFGIEYAGNAKNAMKMRNTHSGNGNAMVMITGSTEVGSIVQNTSSTAYNTSSDYRLKENQVDISDGITRLKTLKPYRFNWKVDPDTTVDGFFAHEVTAVPEAIKGTKDAVASEDIDSLNIKKDDPIYQQIDQSKLVPLLTAALQEAITKIETLETKVAALESA